MCFVLNQKEETTMLDPNAGSALDLRAYLERIHFSGDLDLGSLAPTAALLGALHQAHLLSVPFENLSIHFGQPIRLEDETLYDKIVSRRRGGFCYELNGLFSWLLRRLGYTVSLLSARVAQPDGAYSPEFEHLTLLAHDLEGVVWLADVGFGDSFRLPLRLQPDVEQDGGDGYTYRLSFDATNASWLMRRRGEADWESQYLFTLRPHLMDDFVERCYFQQTSSASHFTQRRICSLALPDGRITLSDLRLSTTHCGTRDERHLGSEDEYHVVLMECFGISLLPDERVRAL
jgi:N-hydroxyarylamine O-acetyltransferase